MFIWLLSDFTTLWTKCGNSITEPADAGTKIVLKIRIQLPCLINREFKRSPLHEPFVVFFFSICCAYLVAKWFYNVMDQLRKLHYRAGRCPNENSSEDPDPIALPYQSGVQKITSMWTFSQSVVLIWLLSDFITLWASCGNFITEPADAGTKIVLKIQLPWIKNNDFKKENK